MILCTMVPLKALDKQQNNANIKYQTVPNAVAHIQQQTYEWVNFNAILNYKKKADLFAMLKCAQTNELDNLFWTHMCTLLLWIPMFGMITVF